MSNQEAMRPSPAQFFETITAYQRSACLAAAIELGVFGEIANGATDAAAISRQCGASERGVRILCDYLTVTGFLQKEGAKYALTRDSGIFLNPASPAYLGGIVGFLGSAQLHSAYDHIAQAIRTGGSALEGTGTATPDHAIWPTFARAMMPLTRHSAEAVAQRLVEMEVRATRVLDVGAGSGLYGIALARRDPALEVVAVDSPDVLAVAEEQAEQAGVASRYRAIPGDALEADLGRDYDLAIVARVLHNYDRATCRQLLSRVHEALREGGRIVIVEFIPNPDRVTPPVPATFSMMMLATTPGGDAYTWDELQEMLDSAGFREAEQNSVLASFETIVTATR